MTVINPPAWLSNAGATHTAAEMRRMFRFAIAGGPGVRTSTDLAVTATGTPDANVHVAAGEAAIAGTESALAQGYYLVFNDAALTVDILVGQPADATNPRNDLVVFKVQDQEYSGATNTSSIAVVRGTPAGSPVDPALPANAIALARVRVDALATTIVAGKITDLRTVAAVPASLYRMKARGTAATALAASGFTKVALQTEDYDPNGNFDNVTNYRWTCPASGRYEVAGQVSRVSTGASTTLMAVLYKNGVNTGIGGSIVVQNGTTGVAGFADVLELVAGDYLELFGWQNDVNPQNMDATTWQSRLAIHFQS